jgi:hypothetical protein
MRIRVTNKSARAGSLLIDEGDEDDERPPRLKKLAAGASIEVRMTQRGHIVVVGFKARVVPLARNGKPEKLSKTNRVRRGKEVKHG